MDQTHFSSGSNDFCNSSSNFKDSLIDFSVPMFMPNKTVENNGAKWLKEQTATEMDAHLLKTPCKKSTITVKNYIRDMMLKKMKIACFVVVLFL